jgi:hypothetical protein
MHMLTEKLVCRVKGRAGDRDGGQCEGERFGRNHHREALLGLGHCVRVSKSAGCLSETELRLGS